MRYQLKAEKYGSGWCVYRLLFGNWERIPFVYSTEEEAEASFYLYQDHI